MKICIFTENYYKGGLDTFLINLCNEWPDGDDDLILLVNASHPGIETIAKKATRQLRIEKYHRLFTSKLASGQIKTFFGLSPIVKFIFRLGYRMLEYPILLPWYCVSLKRYFKKNNFDRLLVVNGGYPASLLCRCAMIAWKAWGKKPLAVFNFHNLATKAPAYIMSIENRIDARVLEASSKVVSVSANCVNSLLTRKSFAGSDKITYIHNGIADPVTGFARKQKKIKNAEAYILMLATYEERKGHAYLLNAFNYVVAEFPTIRLQIYGFGLPEEKARVMDKVKELSLQDKVSLNDFTLRTNELIDNAAVLVVPSQSHESFGLTIIEAMALQTPIVTTDVGGMPEVLANSNAGYVCSKNDPEEFAKAIKKILSDPALRLELGSNGRKIFENKFVASKMAIRYAAIIKTN